MAVPGDIQDGGGVRVRTAGPGDVADLVRMANLLNRHEGLADDAHTGAGMADALFGPRSVCHALVAERDGRPVAYALFSETYNSDRAVRGLWMIDFFVLEEARGQGVGRALGAAVARTARERGCGSIWGAARVANRAARAFYAAMGARDDDVRVLQMDGEALEALAEGPGA